MFGRFPGMLRVEPQVWLLGPTPSQTKEAAVPVSEIHGIPNRPPDGLHQALTLGASPGIVWLAPV